MEPIVREPIRTRAVGWPVLLLFLGVSAAVILLFPVAKRAEPFGRILRGLAWWENLILFGTLLVVAVGGVIFGVGRLRARDLSLGGRKLLEGAIVTVAAWAIMQLWPVVATGHPVIDRLWTAPGPLSMLRWTAVMFLAVAVYEEIAFRGFVFPQLYLKAGGSHWVRFVIALVASQIIFAIVHIPVHITVRHLTGALLFRTVALQAVAGVMLVLLYLRTRNLWIPIGFHGLANAPTPLFAGSMSWEIALLTLLVAWPWLTRRPYERGLARVERVSENPGETPGRFAKSAF
jgi:membrane protease YdiL (CAAX protease family)